MAEPRGDSEFPARDLGFCGLEPSGLPHLPLGPDISNEKGLTFGYNNLPTVV